MKAQAEDLSKETAMKAKCLTSRTVGAMCVVFAMGCGGDPTGNEAGGPDASTLIAFQSGDVTVGAIVYSCANGTRPKAWHDLPSGDPLLLDLFFLGRTSADVANTGPWDEHLAVIREAGGEIVHEYNLMAARASLPRSRLAEVNSVLDVARAVPRPDRRDLYVHVVFEERSESSVIRQFEELGGKVGRVFENFPVLAGGIPDESIPQLRASSNVVSVEQAVVGYCFD